MDTSDGSLRTPHHGATWRGIIDVVVIVFAVSLGCLAAWRAFPVWDDGALWLTGLELGASAISRWQPDRPVIGAILGMLAARDLLGVVGGLVYFGTWVSTGFIAMVLWRRFFPEWAPFGVVAALLAVSPILVETQTIAINPIFSSHLAPMIVYASQWLIWRRGTRGRQVTWLVAGIMIILASLTSEYAALATVVAGPAFYGLRRLVASDPADRTSRRNDRLLLAGTIACGLIGYLVYHSLGSADARPEIRPERQLAALGWRHLMEVPFRLPFSLWTGLFGELLKDMGEANLSRGTAWGIPSGAIVALLVVRRLRGRVTDGGRTTGTPAAWRRGLVLLVPLVVGLCAVLIMSTSIRGNVASRYWLPMIPVTVCLSLFVLLSIVRSKFHVVVAVLCAFTAGYMEGNAARAAHLGAKQTAALGDRFHAELASTGLTVAMFANFPTNHFVGDPVPRPYELIAHMTRGWPQADRARFFAAAYPWQPIHQSVPGLGGVCGPIRQVDSDTLRGWQRRGSVTKVLWVSFDADGAVHIEPGNPPG